MIMFILKLVVFFVRVQIQAMLQERKLFLTEADEDLCSKWGIELCVVGSRGCNQASLAKSYLVVAIAA